MSPHEVRAEEGGKDGVDEHTKQTEESNHTHAAQVLASIGDGVARAPTGPGTGVGGCGAPPGPGTGGKATTGPGTGVGGLAFPPGPGTGGKATASGVGIGAVRMASMVNGGFPSIGDGVAGAGTRYYEYVSRGLVKAC